MAVGSAIATELVVEQGTDEWLEARLGRATASEFKNVITKIKTGEAAARRNYKVQLVLERINGKRAERFKTAAMEWGNETEELAATEYMLKTGNIVETCGIFLHNERMIGDSPDRLVDTDGTVEIKCFNSANHLEALKQNKMPKEHMPQVQGHMWMTNRKWCDFVSFDPDFPADAQLFIQRIYRDEDYIAMLQEELDQFLDEVDAEVEFVKSYKPPVVTEEQTAVKVEKVVEHARS